MGRGFSAVAAFILLAACQPGETDAANGDTAPGEPVVSYACGSGALVDLDQANVERLAKAFGEPGLGARVCALFAPAGGVLPDEGGTVTAELPDGAPATATVRRPPGAA
jgi:hypothetical protein